MMLYLRCVNSFKWQLVLEYVDLSPSAQFVC